MKRRTILTDATSTFLHWALACIASFVSLLEEASQTYVQSVGETECDADIINVGL